MNRFARWGAPIALLLPFAACSTTTPPAAQPMPPTPPPLAVQDATFIQTAAEGGMTEIQMSKLAQQKSKSPGVLKFADKMITDHTANDEQLEKIATAKGATVPTAPSAAQQALITKLEGEKGMAFNRDYIADQVQGHTDMLSAMQTEESSGSDPDLKKFASDTAPVVQEHLDMAKKLQGGHHRMMRHHHHSAS